MPLDRCIAPHTLGLKLFGSIRVARSELGPHFDLDLPQVFPRDICQHSISQQQRPVTTIPPFILDAPIRGPFETAVNLRPKRDVFPWREFFREERPFSNVALQSAIERLRLGLRIALEPLLPAIRIEADPPAFAILSLGDASVQSTLPCH
jgi:hypothetical protein